MLIHTTQTMACRACEPSNVRLETQTERREAGALAEWLANPDHGPNLTAAQSTEHSFI